MSHKVIGVDPSLASTGLAFVGDEETYAGVIPSRGKRADKLPARAERIQDIALEVADWWPYFPTARPADLYVIEGPAHGLPGGSIWDRAGLWWRIVHSLPTDRIAVVSPTTRAKWATGKGNADKGAVAAVAARLCPDVELTSSDAADALILALMGAHALGDRPDLDTQYRGEALLKVAWPEAIATRLLEPYEKAVAG